MLKKILIWIVGGFSVLAAEEPQKNEEIAKVSEAMGHLIGKNLQALGLPLDITALVKGMQEASEGKQSPLSEEDCVQALASLQEEALIKTAEKGLMEANAFLEKNSKRKEVVSIEEGKIQYEVLKAGAGELVQGYNSPLLRYESHYLNGPEIGSAQELVDLKEALPGLSKAVVGMKEGESRLIYIHPDLAKDPNARSHGSALLVFEVEVIKADASAEGHKADNGEIVSNGE